MDESSNGKGKKPIYIDKRLDMSNYLYDYREIETDSLPIRFRLVLIIMNHDTSIFNRNYTIIIGLTPFSHITISKMILPRVKPLIKCSNKNYNCLNKII